LPAAGRRPSPPAASGRQPAGAFQATSSRPALPRPLEASFRFEELARQVVVTLVQPESGAVVRQIPPEKIINLIVYLRQVAGRSFDRRA
jgi:hypothetical protein